MQTLYTHPVTFVTLDYGDELDREYGRATSWTGKAEDAFGFSDRMRRHSSKAARDAEIAEWLTRDGGEFYVLAQGEPIERRVDCNPHGLV